MKSLIVMLAIPFGVLGLSGLTSSARADDSAGPRPTIATEQTVTTGPNSALLHSGIWMFGLSYIPAVVVAAESDRHGDKNLYIPVAGPWMDLASRSACSANASCNHETANKVLIVIDGIFRDLGALDIVGAFVFPETRTVAVSSSERSDGYESHLSLRIVPTKVSANSYGLAVLGTF